jgi:hypothetical protein
MVAHVGLVNGVSVSVGAGQAVSVAAHCVNPARTPGIVAEDSPQGHDVVVDLAQRGFGFEPAHPFHHVDPRHDLAAAQGQDLEDEDVVRGQIQGAIRTTGRTLRLSRSTSCTPQQRLELLDPGGERGLDDELPFGSDAEVEALGELDQIGELA